jgi:type II secretory pathway pseudopilin PulG
MKAVLIVGLTMLIAAPVLAQTDNEAKDAATRVAERDLRDFKRMLPGLYSNEEQVYFQEDMNRPDAERLPKLELQIEPDGDGFIATTRSASGRETEARLEYFVEDGAIRSREIRNGKVTCEREFVREFESFRGTAIEETPRCGGLAIASPEGFQFGAPDRPFNMLRARLFKCWASPRKDDDSYAFYNDLVLHDQGGRVWIDATDEHPRVGLKMRNVKWPAGFNRDSLTLYTYQDDEDYPPAYSWTSPDAERIAINARWLQASCTLGDASITPSLNLETGSGE